MALDKQKIIIINRKDQSISEGDYSKYTVSVLIPIKDLELSQQSKNKLTKLLTKLLLEPKEILINIENSFIGKDGSILDVQI
jgi:hypothetical protein